MPKIKLDWGERDENGRPSSAIRCGCGEFVSEGDRATGHKICRACRPKKRTGKQKMAALADSLGLSDS